MGNYSFYGRLSPLFPSQVIVDVTNVCNLACVSCTCYEKSRAPDFKKAFLSQDLNQKVVNEVREHGAGIAKYIRYTADGEPLLHPNMMELLEYACLNSGTDVVLTTNGTLLDRVSTEYLITMGLLFIDISIDAFSGEVYSLVRKKGSFDKVHDNVMNLITAKKTLGSKTKIVVSFVEQPQNSHESKDFKAYWEQNGADYVIIRRLHSYAGQKPEIVSDLQRNAIARTPCVYPWERIGLKYHGFLTFCPGCPENVRFSDFKTTSIKDVWRGELYNRLRQAHLKNNFSEFELCANCPDWQLIKWPDEGRSYADLVADFNEG